MHGRPVMDRLQAVHDHVHGIDDCSVPHHPICFKFHRVMEGWYVHLPLIFYWDMIMYKKMAAKNLREFARKVQMVNFLLSFI